MLSSNYIFVSKFYGCNKRELIKEKGSWDNTQFEQLLKMWGMKYPNSNMYLSYGFRKTAYVLF